MKAGEFAILVDRRERRYLVNLVPGQTFHTHLGHVSHDQLIGLAEGSWVSTSKGHSLLVLRPLLADIVLEMPRATQVIYPKDLGAILIYGDVFPGARVVEAGLGSSALTLALLRAVGEQGSVVSYEIRQDVVEKAMVNIRAMMSDTANLTIRVADVYQGVQERDVDRLILDVPEPWRVALSAVEALVSGGVFLAFLPTALQVYHLVNALQDTGRFRLIETQEIIARPWHVTRQSLRPAHRMVAHTGFLVRARKTLAKAPTHQGEEDSQEVHEE